MPDHIKATLLVLDPDRDFLEAVSRQDRPNIKVVAEHFDSKNKTSLAQFLQDHYPDIVVINLDVDNELDFGNPISEIHSTPMALCPLVLGTTARDAFSLKQKAYKLGIDDYLLRPFNVAEMWFRLDSLLRIRRLERQIDAASRNLSQLNSKLSSSNRKLEQMTLTDELTGLNNMRYMHKFLENQFMILKRHQRPFSLLMMDLDHFKSVNDRNDHLVGSATISRVGKIIDDVMRKMDVKARYGGDEYIIAMPETDKEGALLGANRLGEAIGKAVHLGSDGNEFSVTASMGIAGYDPQRHDSYKELVKDADCALYEAKHQGRNRAVYYEHGVTPRPDPDKLERT